MYQTWAPVPFSCSVINLSGSTWIFGSQLMRYKLLTSFLIIYSTDCFWDRRQNIRFPLVFCVLLVAPFAIVFSYIYVVLGRIDFLISFLIFKENIKKQNVAHVSVKHWRPGDRKGSSTIEELLFKFFKCNKCKYDFFTVSQLLSSFSPSLAIVHLHVRKKLNYFTTNIRKIKFKNVASWPSGLFFPDVLSL